jgi:nicotinamidase-related amidase
VADAPKRFGAISTAMPADLPLPPHYDPRTAAEHRYSPDQGRLFAAANAWRREHALAPAIADRANVHLLLIDVQRDFCFPEGSLYVGGRSGRGALEDNRRTAEFIYRNLARLTNITATLDTHHAFQIFFPSFWRGADGQPLQAHRTVTADDVASGSAQPNPDVAGWLCDGDVEWLRREVLHYCRELEKGGRYTLYLWPPHCLLGSEGHALAGAVHEARLFHSWARAAQSWAEIKGDNPITENYSVLRPEVLVRHDGRPLASRNLALIDTLLRADALVVAGQAASHCVKSSVDDLLEAIQARDARLAQRVYLMVDCMSAVVVPDGKGGFAADFTPQAEAALQRYAAAGMRLVQSTEPLASWPGLAQALQD